MLLTKAQIADRTGYSPRTIERFVREGVPDPHGGPNVILPVVRTGGLRGWRAREADLVDFLSRLVTVGQIPRDRSHAKGGRARTLAAAR